MLTGIFAGVTWALETVILGIALSSFSFVSSQRGVFLAPFICTFIHDMVSAVYMLVFNGYKHNLKEVFRIFKTKNFKWLVLTSAIGGPVGMTGYVMAVNYMGASIGAVASAVYPAIGSVLAYLVLKEKIKCYQWVFLLITLFGVYCLSYSPKLNIENFLLGLCGVFMCAFGWGIEGVILSGCLKDTTTKSEYALQIRQLTSALIYGLIILPGLSGWEFTAGLIVKDNTIVLLTIAASALCATLSYLLYYKTIASLGVSKAMGLNITYTAWAMIFNAVIHRDIRYLNIFNVVCAAIVVICGIFAAIDFKELFNLNNRENN